jgi:hypothetical protein
MRKSKLVAAALAVALAFSSVTSSVAAQVVTPPAPASSPGVVWGVFGCATSIILAALVAGQRNKRELTTPEALTCGLLFWASPSPAN